MERSGLPRAINVGWMIAAKRRRFGTAGIKARRSLKRCFT
jgi:hypothetical protein